MTIKLMNADGKYTAFAHEIIMGKQTYEYLLQEKDSPVQKELDLILPLINSLPVYQFRKIFSSSMELKLYGNGTQTIKGYGVTIIHKKGTAYPEENFKLFSNHKADPFGYEIINKLANNKSFIEAYDKVMKYYKFIGEPDIKSLNKKVQKNRDVISGITMLDEVQQILGTDCSVVIFDPKENGFLNDKGKFTSLSSARCFQSVAVAQTTARSRGLINAIFVDVDVKFKKVSDDQTHNITDFGTLGVVIAEKEKEELAKTMGLTEDGHNDKIIDALKEKYPEIYEEILDSFKPKTAKTRRM